MSRYVNIATRIWHDEKFRELPDDAKMLFIYLLTCPHGNMCGLFYLPALYACHDLGWTEERYMATIGLLQEQVCTDEDVVLIKNFVRYNPIKGSKQAIGAARRLQEVPETSLMVHFLEILKENTLPDDYITFTDTLSIPYLTSENTPSIPGTDTDTGTESEAETDKKPPTPFQSIVDLFHSLCPSLPKIRTVTEKRKTDMRVRWKKYSDIAIYEELFKKAEASDFLTGRNGKWAGCNFDWLLKEANMIKVLEGNYDNERSATRGASERHPAGSDPAGKYRKYVKS